MTVFVMLDVKLQPADLPGGYAGVSETLKATRGFAGCLGVEVVVDVLDPGHVIAIEQWESIDAVTAYRAWRDTAEGAPSALIAVPAGPPAMSDFKLDPAI